MRCPFCGHDDSTVRDSRPIEDHSAIRRRRACTACAARFTTFERVQLRELMVQKRSGLTEPFNRDKLERSIMIALRKRPVAQEQIDKLITGIVRQLESSGESNIAVEIIGERVMDALKDIDSVAYVRFASVYRDFRAAEDFEDFIGNLKTPNLKAL